MNFKTTLLLIVLLVLVGAYIAFDRSKGDAPATPPPAVAVHILPPEFNVVGMLHIRWGDQQIKLQKSGDNWQMLAPVVAAADRMAVNQYLATLTAAESKGEPGAGAKAEFTPAVTVDLAGKSVQVSRANSVGDAVVKVSDNENQQWFLTSGSLAESLSRTAASFRDPRLVSASFGEIRSVKLQQGKAAVTVTKSGDTWEVSDGSTTLKADEAAVGDLLQVITGLKAAEVPATEPLMAFDITPLIVTLTTAPATSATTLPIAATAPAAKEEVIRFGRFEDARRERVIVNAAGVTAYVPGFTLNSMNKSLLDLRDRQVLTFGPADIEQIEISNETIAATRPATAVSLRLVSGQIMPPATAPSAPRWMQGDAPADPEKIAALLDALRPLMATHFLAGDAATKPSTPWLARIKTAGGVQELHVGERAARLGELTFEPSTPLLPLISTPFVRPAPIETPPAATTPTTAPATMP